jgi:hypothetical protein
MNRFIDCPRKSRGESYQRPRFCAARVKIHLSTDEMPTAPKSLTFSTTPPYGEFVLRSEQMQN